MRLLLLAALAVLALAGCGGDGGSETEGAQPAGTASEIVDVDGVEPLREQFNADAGKPRLLVLLSPT